MAGGMFNTPIVGGRVHKQPSCNEILPRLYLGDILVATNKEEIKKLGITHMITVEIKPLQASDLSPTIQNYLYINVMDHSKQDILSHFDTSNEFIETALKNPSNKVYVHCVAGISRSATLIIAYIMKTRSMNYNEAFQLVSEKRKIIDPNEGFVRQLSLYHHMHYAIDIGNIDYRRMVLEALVFEFRLIHLSYYHQPPSVKNMSAAGSTADSRNSAASSSIVNVNLTHALKNANNRNNVWILFEQYYSKLNFMEVNKFPHVYDPKSAHQCNKCRVIIFYSISIIENKQPHNEKLTTFGSGSSAFKLQSIVMNKDQNKECPFIFIEPQPWMSKNILERDGTLHCYSCKRKLGKFDWTSGESCSCPRHNSHMNFNLFKIMRKKVDFGSR